MHANKEESRGGYQQVCFAWGDAWLYLLLAVRFCRTGSILCLYHPAAIGSHMWDWGGGDQCHGETTAVPIGVL